MIKPGNTTQLTHKNSGFTTMLGKTGNQKVKIVFGIL